MAREDGRLGVALVGFEDAVFLALALKVAPEVVGLGRKEIVGAFLPAVEILKEGAQDDGTVFNDELLGC